MRAWWPLDELAGTNAQDVIGVNDGAYGSSGHQAGQYVANSVSLTAATQFVQVANNSALNFTGTTVGTYQNFTIDAWVRTSDAITSVRTIVDKRADPGGRGYSLAISFGQLVFQLSDPSGFTIWRGASTPSGFLYANGAWNHVAVTVDRIGNKGRFYVNGVHLGADDFTPNTTAGAFVGRPGSIDNTGPLRMGQAYDNSSINFNGNIDEVELYGRAIDSTEVLSIFNARTAGKCKPFQKDIRFFFGGTNATAAGSFVFNIVARNAACSPALYSHNQGYDAAAGGPLPTSATEIRDVTAAGLTSLLTGAPYSYTVTSYLEGGAPAIQISTTQNVDLCVDGVKIVSGDVIAGVPENGITVSGFSKSKSNGVPGLTWWGTLVLTMLLLGSGWFVINRRRQEGLGAA